MGPHTYVSPRRVPPGPAQEHRQPQCGVLCLDRILRLLRTEGDWRIEGAAAVRGLEGPRQLVATLGPPAMPAHLQHGAVVPNAAIRSVRDDARRLLGPNESGGKVRHLDMYRHVHSGGFLWLRGLLHTGVLR